jgi:tight adherence protein B
VRALIPFGAAALAGTGVYLVYTSFVYGGRPTPSKRRRLQLWMEQSGLAMAAPAELGIAFLSVALFGIAGGYLLFGAPLPAVATGLLAAGLPLSAYRSRREARLAAAADSWPRLLEEIRLRTGSLGRSVPQALFDAGRRAPAEWRPAFVAAEREWLLTTDFGRTLELLKGRLADATADAVCETLMVAHELGGADLEARLKDLIDDRIQDLEDRKDALTRQAGVRFARRFVLLVPLGMALAGLTIGTGRAAYASAGGQVAVVAALVSVAGCWLWSGRLMRLPRPPRVFQ